MSGIGDPQQYTTSEVGRNLSEIKSEQRAQRETLGHIAEKLAALPAAQTIAEERTRELTRRVQDIEKREDERDKEAAVARRWLVASICLPVFGLIAGPVVALIITGSLN